MKNSEILKRLNLIGLYPKKVRKIWECKAGNGKLYRNTNLAGLFGLPSKTAKELFFLTK